LPRTCLPSGNDNNTGSSASFARIKAWLDICTSSHPACSQADCQPPPLPTRVISVGTKGSSKCYLVSGNQKNGHYATLSHCWGDPRNRPLSTNDRTLPCRQRGIEDKRLPKTFRHAIQVCREIGIEYIWIDSLCIIQGQESQEDWTKEAPKMGAVYGNSLLNISAAAAADSTQGCFKERLGLMIWPCQIMLFGHPCYISRYPMHDEEISGDPGDQNPWKGNLSARRAWILQEQILSRRSIIFSQDLLIWRCPTLSTNEKFPLGIPHAPNISFDNHRLLQCIVNDIKPSIPKEQTVDNHGCWYRIVEEFTSRVLTYEDDKLPAIAGIAKRFGVAVDDSYHAGLWRQDLIRGLSWCAKDNTAICKARSPRAPSWSWASINGGVSYSHLLPNDHTSRVLWSPLINILDVSDPTTCEDHPFGATSRASFSLSGVLLAVRREEHNYPGLVLVGHSSGFPSPTFFPDVQDINWSDRKPLVCLPLCIRLWRHYRSFFDDGELNRNNWERFLEEGEDVFTKNNILYCLILQAIEGSKDKYRRVGLWMVFGELTMEASRMALFDERRSITII